MVFAHGIASILTGQGFVGAPAQAWDKDFAMEDVTTAMVV